MATRRHAAMLASLICALALVSSTATATGNFNELADYYTTKDARDQRTQLEGTPLSSPIVKTYEQVVLEGSKVYLACPHARLHHTIIRHHQGSSQNPLQQDPLTGTRSGALARDSEKIKQQTLPTINSLDQNNDDASVEHIFSLNDEEPVKWFKNHVPMRRESSSPAAANLPKQQSGEIGAAQNNGLMVGPSGRTIEFNFDDVENTNSFNSDVRAVSLMRGNEFSSTNQQQQQQQQLNNRADWHINELGELVLERVTKYFSGKYTCLNNGQQSELLLDVVPTDVSNRRSRPFINPFTTIAAATTSDVENDSNLDITTSVDGNEDEHAEDVREERATTSAQMMSAVAHTNLGRASVENGRRARNVLEFQPPSSFNSLATSNSGANAKVLLPPTRTLPAVVVDELPLPPQPPPPPPPLYWAPGSGQIDRASRVDVANANVTLTPKTIVAGQLLNDVNNGHGNDVDDKDFRRDTGNIFGDTGGSGSYNGPTEDGLELDGGRGEIGARVSSDQVKVFTPVQRTDLAIELPKSSKENIESDRGQQEQQFHMHKEQQSLFTNPEDKDLFSPQRRRRTIPSQPQPPMDMSEARDWYNTVHTDRDNISSAANSGEQQTNLQQPNQKGGGANYTRKEDELLVAVGKHYDKLDDEIAEAHKFELSDNEEEEEEENDVDEEIESILARHVKRRAPIHFIDSDIISPSDLDSVPGLMYTKQRLYCPALNQRDIRLALREQIFILVRKFCPRVKPQQRRHPMNISSSLNATPEAGDSALHKCENLATHLIRQLLNIGSKCNSTQIAAATTSSSSSSSDQPFRPTISGVHSDPLQPATILTQCSHEFANFLDLIWYKDGMRLEFDPLTGRGMNKKLNLKLIDFIDQFEMTEKGTRSSNDDNGTRSSSGKSSGGSSSDGVTSRRVSLQSEANRSSAVVAAVGRRRRAPLIQVGGGGGDIGQASSWPSSLYQRQQQQQASRKRKRQQQRRQRLRQRRWRRGQPDGEHYEQVAAAAASWRGRTRRHGGPAALLPPSPVCPPRGLILEIDGIHRANAGRYTCALRFNITKLLTFLRTLRQLNVPSTSSSGGPINWRRAGCLLDCCCGKNDKSKQRCDHLVEAAGAYHSGDVPRQAHRGGPKENAEAQMELDNAPEMAGLAASEIRSALAAAQTNDGDNDDDNIEQRGRRQNGNGGFVGPLHSSRRVSSALDLSGREIEKNTTPGEPSDSSANIDSNGNNNNNIIRSATITANEKLDLISLAKQINALGSILNGTLSSQETVDHIGRSLAGPQPLTIIQTFVLIVTERPANSCQLWSTILDANEAHSRRKLADFKRLKRSLAASRHDLRPAQQWNSPLNGQQISPLASLGSSSSSSSLLSSSLSDDDWRRGNERKGDKLATPASLSWSNGASPSEQPLASGSGGSETYAVNNMRRAANDVARLSEAIEGRIVNYYDYAHSAALGHSGGQHFDDKANAVLNDLNGQRDDSDEGGADRLPTGTKHKRRVRRATTQDAISVASDDHSNDDQTVGLKGSTAAQSNASNHDHYAAQANQKERLERPQAISSTGLLNKPRQSLSTPPSPPTLPPSAIEKQWAAREMPFNYANERNLKRHHHSMARGSNNKNNSTGATKITNGGGADASMMVMMIKHQLAGSKDGGYKIRQTDETLVTMPRAAGGYRDEDDEHHYSAGGSSGPVVVVVVAGATAGNETKDFSTQSQRINTRRQTELTLRHDDDDESANQSARPSDSIDMKTADGSSSTWQSNAFGSRAPIPHTGSSMKTTTMSQLSSGTASHVKIDDRHGAQSNILAKLGQVMRSAYIIDGNNLAKSTRTAAAVATTTTTTPKKKKTSAKLTATRDFDAMVIGHAGAKSNTRKGGRQFDRRTGETNRVGGEGNAQHARRRRSTGLASWPSDSGQTNLADRRARKSALEFVTEKSNIQQADGGANIEQVTYQHSQRSQRRETTRRATYAGEQSNENYNEHEKFIGDKRGQPAPPMGPQREHQSDDRRRLKSGDKLDTSGHQQLGPDERLNLGSANFQDDKHDNDNSLTNGKLLSSSSEDADEPIGASTGALGRNYNRLIDENVEGSELAMNGNDDESLLWTASQYLYMHMRALASSSIYGVQVDVEWSNENERIINRTATAAAAAATDARQNIQVVPFATIDLVAGQNLHLQCTAQALGRLPEVKWYKRIGGKIPDYISAELVDKLARSIGRDTYWPVAELDLLNDDLHNSKNFVCSQSISIFDNLLNQTFTVVNNLKLSQFNDKIELTTLAATRKTTSDRVNGSPLINPSTSDDSSLYNLYACFVDADIRHDYATLGVYFRQANAKLPIELTKRLKARSMFNVDVDDTQTVNHIIPTSKSSQANADPTEVSNFGRMSMSEYNMLRQSHLIFPYKRMWVPLRQNGTYLGSGRSDEDAEETLFLLNNYNSSFPMSPLVLSVVIALVFGSLLGLVYLTLRSYQALTSNQQHLDEEHDEDGNNLRCKLLSPTDNNWTQTSESYCHFNLSDRSVEHTLDADVQLDDVGLMQDYQIINPLPPAPPSAILRAPTVLLDRTNSASTSSLYSAHIHNLDDLQCDYSENRALTMNLIVGDNQEELETSLLSTTHTDQLQSSNVKSMINIMSNPLNNDDDDNS